MMFTGDILNFISCNYFIFIVLIALTLLERKIYTVCLTSFSPTPCGGKIHLKTFFLL